MARKKRKKEALQGIACYLCQDGSVADTTLTLGDLLSRVDAFPNKLFTIKPGLDLQEWPESLLGPEPKKGRVPLVIFKEEGAYFDVLSSFGDAIGQSIIVCEVCCDAHKEVSSLMNALHEEFDRRLAGRYEWLCRSLFDHDLLRFDPEALEKAVKKFGGKNAVCQQWLATLQEINHVASHEHIEKVRQRLAPLMAALARVGQPALKIV